MAPKYTWQWPTTPLTLYELQLLIEITLYNPFFHYLGTEIYVAAVYDAPDLGEVNGIASDPDSEHVVLVPDADSVEGAANQILDWLCDS